MLTPILASNAIRGKITESIDSNFNKNITTKCTIRFDYNFTTITNLLIGRLHFPHLYFYHDECDIWAFGITIKENILMTSSDKTYPCQNQNPYLTRF